MSRLMLCAHNSVSVGLAVKCLITSNVAYSLHLKLKRGVRARRRNISSEHVVIISDSCRSEFDHISVLVRRVLHWVGWVGGY